MTRKYIRTDRSPLSVREADFVIAFIRERNVENAAIASGYAPLHGEKVARRPNVKRAIREQLRYKVNRMLLTPDMVLSEIAALATSDIGDVLDFTSADGIPTPKPVNAITEQARKAIQSVKIKYGQDGQPQEVEYKLWDKGSAQDRLARYFGLFLDQEEFEQLKLKMQALIAKAEQTPAQIIDASPVADTMPTAGEELQA